MTRVVVVGSSKTDMVVRIPRAPRSKRSEGRDGDYS